MELILFLVNLGTIAYGQTRTLVIKVAVRFKILKTVKIMNKKF